MASRKGIECATWRPRSKLTSGLQLHLCGSLFNLDKELLALKSAKVAKLLQQNNTQEELSLLLRDIPANQESMDLVAKFCHGFDCNLTTENAVRVACVAEYLGMTESHCPNNLLNKALSFFDHQIIPNWNNCIKALKTAESVLQQAADLGLLDYCVESIISKVIDDPRLLGEPIKNNDDSDDNDNNNYKPNARRKLFDIDWKPENLSSLSLRLYAPIIEAMQQRQIPLEYISANLCEYAKTWVFNSDAIGNEMPIFKRNSQREIVEAIVRLLPDDCREMVSCTFLFEMLRFAIALDASFDCRNELEFIIGKQLDEATVKDLMIPAQGYAREEQYDTECVRRILKNFYNNYSGPDQSGLVLVAELIDQFLAEISSDIDLKIATFVTFADMSAAAASGSQRSSDGVYRAIDIYLDKHRYLTELEREEVCKVLDCTRLSGEACEHAAKNERLPVRVVVQTLFAAQLRLRDAIPKEVVRVVGEEEEDEEDGDEVRAEIEKMGSKVMELERECSVMRREIQGSDGERRKMEKKKKKKKVSVWKEMKRKFGCGTSIDDDCNCHVKKKKVHPR